MNDPLSDLEQELRELTPAAPSTEFIGQIEEGLGSQANLAVFNNPESSKKIIVFPSLRWGIAAAFLFLLGIVSSAFYFQSRESEQIAKTKIEEVVPAAPIENQAPPKDNNWQPMEQETILVDVRNEGVIHSPQNPPSQQFRYKYMDTTKFTDPNSQSEIHMAVPREQVIQVKLEPY